MLVETRRGDERGHRRDVAAALQDRGVEDGGIAGGQVGARGGGAGGIGAPGWLEQGRGRGRAVAGAVEDVCGGADTLGLLHLLPLLTLLALGGGRVGVIHRVGAPPGRAARLCV